MRTQPLPQTRSLKADFDASLTLIMDVSPYQSLTSGLSLPPAAADMGWTTFKGAPCVKAVLRIRYAATRPIPMALQCS